MTDERTYDAAANEDRRMSDRRRGSTVAEPMAEPVTDTAYGTNRESVPSEPVESQRTSRTMGNWPEMAEYRTRFDEIQAQFIEDPKEAVKKAEKLVEEAIDRMTASMRDRIDSMHGDAASGDTEKLRVEMKTLRDFIESLGGRRAA